MVSCSENHLHIVIYVPLMKGSVKIKASKSHFSSLLKLSGTGSFCSESRRLVSSFSKPLSFCHIRLPASSPSQCMAVPLAVGTARTQRLKGPHPTSGRSSEGIIAGYNKRSIQIVEWAISHVWLNGHTPDPSRLFIHR